MPLILIAFFVTDLLSIAYPFVAYYLYNEWDKYRNTIDNDYAQRCLYGAIALLVFILLGKFLVKALLSKRRKGEDEPQMFTPEKKIVSNALMAVPLTLSIMARRVGNLSFLYMD